MTAIHSKEKRNPVADMILSCVQHYAKHNRYIDTLTLEPIRWNIFKAWLQRQDEEKAEEIHDEVHFRDIKIKKAKFQVDPIKVTFKKSNGQVQLQ